MAKKNFLVDIDLMNNQLLNGVIQNLATAPTGKPAGSIYYNTTDNYLYLYNGTAWISLVYIHQSHPSGTFGTGNQVIKSITVNSQGHVTAVTAANLTAADMAAILNDSVTASTTTWSSTKIQAELTALEGRINTSITGGLINKGGYDAATNTPLLDATPIAGIKNGWTYVVTAAGTFFTEDVQVGDMVIAKQDTPTTLAHWTIVNKNIPDIVSSSETAQGIIEIATQAEVNTGTDDQRAVTPLKMKTYVAAQILTGAYSATFGDGTATSFTITHGLNTKQVLVAVIDETTGIQHEVEWAATTTSAISINVNAAPTLNKYRVIIQK